MRENGCAGKMKGMSETFGEMLDTPPAARRFYFEHLAALTSTQRLALLNATSGMIRAVAEGAIRRAHPRISPDELRIRLAVRLYGRAIAERVFGNVPEDAR